MLSAFQAVCTFVHDAAEKYLVLPAQVRGELRKTHGLCLLAVAGLSLPHSPLVHVGDSSDNGWVLMYGSFDTLEVYKECRWREKWRFLEVIPEPAASSVTGQQLELFGALSHLGGDAPVSGCMRCRCRGASAAPARRSTQFESWLSSRLLATPPAFKRYVRIRQKIAARLWKCPLPFRL